jgi:hypothetical protein
MGCAWVDPADGWVLKYRWVFNRAGYVVRDRGRKLYLHRAVMGSPEGDVGFRDGDRANCTRGNLILSARRGGRRPRVAVRRGAYRGVYARTHGGYWASLVLRSGVELYLGDYRDQVMAAKMVDAAIRFYRPADRRTNFPGDLAFPRWRILQAAFPRKGFRGVSRRSKASFRARYGQKVLGHFRTPERAALSYDRYVRRKYPGRPLNFP